MSRGKRYFLTSLALPIAIPIAIIPFGINNALSAILIFSIGFGGIPYLAMCIGIFMWAKNKNEREIRKLSYFIPLIYAAILIVILSLWWALTSGPHYKIVELLGLVLLFGIYAIIIGYAYVLLVNLVYEFALSKYEVNALTKTSSRRAKGARG